ncbi:MAG: hypothetical protein IKG93_04360 [Clostridiales bacterium]|nr:hypothetical protein [Clostridiales bacterium]
MAKNCPGCGAPMEYDPSFDSLVCQSCGNIIDPQSLPDADDFYLNMGEEPVDVREIYDEDELTNEMYDCHIYTCSQCGGEVIVSGTEVSTRCVYCGSTAVVFNRVARDYRPDYIIPFKITKEEAVEKVKKQLRSGFFVPGFFKKAEPTVIRGIYIPYYLYNGTYTDTQRFQIGTNTTIFDGSCEFVDLPVESCKMLSDRTSDMLDPYYMNEKVEFDTSYLMGFYANVRDLEPRAAQGNANMKARRVFEKESLKQIPKSVFGRKRLTSVPVCKLQRTSYAMLPAWFVSFNKNGTPYTFVVNGQTGKVAGAVPWNRFLATLMIIGTFVGLVALSTFLFFGLDVFKTVAEEEIDLAVNHGRISNALSSSQYYLCGGIGTAALGVLGFGFARFKHVIDHLNLSRSIGTFIFSKKRQGDVK